jgi:hypothetical protein
MQLRLASTGAVGVERQMTKKTEPEGFWDAEQSQPAPLGSKLKLQKLASLQRKNQMGH